MMWPSLTVKSVKKPWPATLIFVPPRGSLALDREGAVAEGLVEARGAAVGHRAGDRGLHQLLHALVVARHLDAAMGLRRVGLDGALDSPAHRADTRTRPRTP